MYDTHQKQIADYAKTGPDATARIIKFVLISIRRRFDCVAPIMRDEVQIGLMDTTKEGIAYAEEHKIRLHAAIHDKYTSLLDKLLVVREVPGLGLPKAGFVLQLATDNPIIACQDSHNLKRFELKASVFSTSGQSAAVIRRKAQTYIELCEKLGGSRELWDS